MTQHNRNQRKVAGCVSILVVAVICGFFVGGTYTALWVYALLVAPAYFIGAMIMFLIQRLLTDRTPMIYNVDTNKPNEVSVDAERNMR